MDKQDCMDELAYHMEPCPTCEGTGKVYYKPDIGRLLKALRIDHEMKQKDVAKALSISPQYLHDIEDGYRPVTVAFVRKYVDCITKDVENG